MDIVIACVPLMPLPLHAHLIRRLLNNVIKAMINAFLSPDCVLSYFKWTLGHNNPRQQGHHHAQGHPAGSPFPW